MNLDDIVEYELDIDIDIKGTQSTVLKKIGLTKIQKGDKLPLGDLLVCALEFSRKDLLIMDLIDKYGESLKEDKDLFLQTVYETHFNKSAPFMYYFTELHDDLKKAMVYFYFQGLIENQGYFKMEESLVYEMLGDTKTNIQKWSKKIIDMAYKSNFLDYFSRDYRKTQNDGLVLIFNFIAPELPIFKNIKEIDFKQVIEKNKQKTYPIITTLTSIQTLSPLIFDLFLKKTDYIKELSSIYDNNIDNAFREVTNQQDLERGIDFIKIIGLNTPFLSTVANVFAKSTIQDKKEILLTIIEKNLKQTVEDTNLIHSLGLFFNMLEKTKEGDDLLRSIEKFIITKDIIQDIDSNSFSINVDKLLKISLLNSNDYFFQINNGETVNSHVITVKGKTVKKQIENFENNVDNKEKIDFFETLVCDSKFKNFVKVIRKNNVDIDIFKIKEDDSLVKITVADEKYKEFVKKSLSEYIYTSKERVINVVNTFHEEKLMKDYIIPNHTAEVIVKPKLRKF